MKLRPSHIRCLQFVKDHPGGTRHKSFPFGHHYRFEAPEYKRSPFQLRTLVALVDAGYVDTTNGLVKLSQTGMKALEPYT
jgi:hypothetical protein